MIPGESQIEAGATVTYTVILTNTTADALSDVVISGTIPPSTTFITTPASPILYDGTTSDLTWNVGAVLSDTILTATYQVQAQATLSDTQVVAGVAATSPDLTGTLEGWDVIDVGEPPTDTKWITPEGGFLKAGDTPVTVMVPTDALTQPLEFTVVPLTGTLDAALWNAFDFTATSATDEVISSFPVSITVAINLDEHWESVLATEGTPAIYWLNDNTATWELVPGEMNWATGVVSAEVNHFSGYGSGSSDNGSYGVEHLPTLGRFSSDEWSGNSSVSYGFTLPPAPGNMPFGLNLNYSSEGVNALYARDASQLGDAVSRYARQAGIAGWGWNLGGLGSLTPTGNYGAMIRAGSVSAEVTWKDDGVSNGTWDWQTDPQQFVKIHSMREGVDEQIANRTTKWELFTQDGMRYTFGADSFTSTAVAYNRRVTPNCSGGNDELTRELHLSEIRDVHGNRIVIDYQHETRNWSNGCNPYLYVRAVRPYLITYYPAAVAEGSVQIEFKYEGRTDRGIEKYLDPLVQGLWSDYRLQAIEIKVWGSGGYEPAQKYSFVYDYTSFNDPGNAEKQLLRLREIYDMGQNWTNGVSLPAYRFEYAQQNSGLPNTTVLTKAHNGQGGRVEYTYSYTSGIPIWGCNVDPAEPNGTWPQEYGARYQVWQTQTFDGLQSAPVQQVLYTYANGYAAAQEDPVCAKDFEFGGYGTVTKEIRDGGTVLQRIVNSYHTGDGDAVAAEAGKLSLSQTKDAAGVLLAQRHSIWVEGSVATTPWVYLAETTETTKGANSTLDVSRRTVYQYRPENQGNAQFGLQTDVREEANGALVRRSESWYIQDTVNGAFFFRPIQTKTFNGGTTCTGATRFGYDYQAYGVAPSSAGNRTDVWVATTGCPATVTTPLDGTWLRTQMSYDAWGNTISSTDPRGNVTSTTYDTGGASPKLYAYPTGSSAPLSMSTSYSWNKFLGQVETVTASNGAQTNYRYDEWGRLLKMWKPGDSENTPTQSSTYYNYDAAGLRPYMVNVGQRMNLSTDNFAYTTQSATFYDGLGRALQSRSSHYDTATSTEEWVVTLNRYHPLGGVWEQYAPVAVPVDGNTLRFYEYGDTTANWSLKTTSTYDALGRVRTITDPSGAVTTHSYGTENVGGVTMTHHAIMDANRHRTRYQTDALGRMHAVIEQTGNCGAEAGYSCGGSYTTPWSDYATTTYLYDSSDRLTGVQDPVTDTADLTLTYDLAGRKIGMYDPDMGTWAYLYDRAGNLVAQRDSNNNALCFTYDALNRVTHKHAYINIAAPLDVVDEANGYACNNFLWRRYEIQTSYGAGGYGLGQRTGLNFISHTSAYDNSQGGQGWTYDTRGRVTTETTRITYNSATYRFKFGYAYDAADRVRTVQYPDDTPLDTTPGYGETVTYQYSDPRQMLLRGTQGTNAYLSNREYNHYGQITQQSYGTTPETVQSYTYFGLNVANGQGRVQSVAAVSNGNTRQALSYSYDKVGNILTIVDANATGGTQTQNMQYDALDRLQRYAAEGVVEGSWGAQWFDYQPSGNLREIRNGSATGALQRTYNNSAQRGSSDCSVGWLNPAHATVARIELPANIRTDYCYDAAGNMVERQQVGSAAETLLYDMENRLTHVFGGSANATFAYNGDGARIWATINGVTTLYAGAIEYEIGTNTLTKYYDAGGQRVAVRNGASLNYLLNDHLGSTSVILKTNGALWGELRYSAWGQTRYSNGSIVTDRQFTGQINDGATGLYYYNARYYDPALHRFIQADTIVPDPNNPQTLNRFSYVGNNPVKYTDPTGHEEQPADCPPNSQDCVPWTLEQWIQFGLIFTRDPGASFGWTNDLMMEVVNALNNVKGYYGMDIISSIFSGSSGKHELILATSANKNYQVGADAAPWDQKIRLFKQGDVEAIVAHELGHFVDYRAGGGCWFSDGEGCGSPNSGGGWTEGVSGYNLVWGIGDTTSPSWQYQYGAKDRTRNAPSYYGATGGPKEDFAETFTWRMYNTDSRKNYRFYQPNDERIQTLNVALDKLR